MSTCSGEVSLSVDSLAVLEVTEEYDPDEGIAGDEGEHAHDNEKALVHRNSVKKGCLYRYINLNDSKKYISWMDRVIFVKC